MSVCSEGVQGGCAVRVCSEGVQLCIKERCAGRGVQLMREVNTKEVSCSLTSACVLCSEVCSEGEVHS